MFRQQRNWHAWNARICGIIVFGLLTGHGFAAADEVDSDKLPIQRIVLFNSGVGFFEHRGTVDGDDQVELKFKTEDINDLLKSLVLQDLGGGKISTVSYGSKDPIQKTLKTFAIDLTGTPTLFELLSQVRGQKLIVYVPQGIRGTLVGVESRPTAVPGGESIRTDHINLLTDDGLQTIALSSIERIQMADRELQKEFEAALAILASAHSTDKKAVTLNFLGEGKRPVRVGYIREAPVWKTSYRLVMNDKNAPLLQGWAIVENTGDQDWNHVDLSLISGRPISFAMDLYSPLYASRPQVAHELYASLQPQEYGQAMEGSLLELAEPQSAMVRGRSAPTAGNGRLPKGLGGRRGGGYGGGGYGGAGSFGGEYDYESKQGEEDPFADFDVSEGVEAAADEGKVGELFRYDIDTPVSIKRQRSAMLPIVNQAVEASKVSIYNRDVHAKHPLNGIRLINSSDLHLMQGPITLFDGGVYAGDGKIGALPPGEERLVSYAMDLDVEVAPLSKAATDKLVTVKIVNGMLHAKRHYLRTFSYKIKNSSDKTKSILIEQPKHDHWKLVDEELASETTRDRHRFAVTVDAGQTENLVVKQHMDGEQVINLRKSNDNRYELYLSAKEVSDEVKQALQDYRQRRAELLDITQQASQRQTELTVIDKEQSRIRKNMQQLSHNSELYKRYIKKFTEQEDRVEQLNAEIRKLKQTAVMKQNELRARLEGLDVG